MMRALKVFGLSSSLVILAVIVGNSSAQQSSCAITQQGQWDLGAVEEQVIWNSPDQNALVTVTSESKQYLTKVVADGKEYELGTGSSVTVLAKSINLKKGDQVPQIDVFDEGKIVEANRGKVLWESSTPKSIELRIDFGHVFVFRGEELVQDVQRYCCFGSLN